MRELSTAHFASATNVLVYDYISHSNLHKRPIKSIKDIKWSSSRSFPSHTAAQQNFSMYRHRRRRYNNIFIFIIQFLIFPLALTSRCFVVFHVPLHTERFHYTKYLNTIAYPPYWRGCGNRKHRRESKQAQWRRHWIVWGKYIWKKKNMGYVDCKTNI